MTKNEIITYESEYSMTYKELNKSTTKCMDRMKINLIKAVEYDETMMKEEAVQTIIK